MGVRADKKAATKAKLVAVAREAFQRQGFEAVTFRSLAAEARVSTGGFFAHWKGKAELFAEAMGRPAPDVVQFLERVAIERAGTQLSNDALDLRKDLIGAG